jgi:radical SAM superfamily enzyme YgiQ (UPF0313 family)
MRVLFSHAYFLEEDLKEQQIMKPYPPLGILYLSAWLEKHGYANEVFDTTFSNKQAFKEYLVNFQPDIIALYTNLITKLNVIELVRWIKQNPFIKPLIVIGGPDITYNVENYLDIGADLVVFGEGEQTMLEIVRESEKSEPDWKQIPGVAYKINPTAVFKTKPREKIKDLEELPLPNRKKIDLAHYLRVWKQYHGKSAVSVSTQRGCPYTCKWCSTAVYGQSYRRKSPTSVVDELELIRDEYNPDQIWFVDDVFTVSHKWLRAFHEESTRRDVKIPFECITRAERLSEEIITILKEVGCFRIWIGAESGSQRIIDAMDRRVDVDQVSSMIQTTRQAGIEAGTFIMLGYPGETEDDIFATLHHLKKANPDQLTVTVAYPIKGTALHNQVEHEMIGELDWKKSTDRDIDFKRTYQRKYYDYALPWLVRSVHWHKKKLQSQHLTPRGVAQYIMIKLLRIGMIYHRNFP